MPNHVIRQGDCLSSIAERYGIPKQTIWQHAKNSELREQRLNPDALFPGDVLYVPPITKKEIECPVDQKYKFLRKLEPVRFRLRLLLDEEPRANEPYVLEVGSLKFTGTTDGNGRLDEEIPAGAPQGRLILNDGTEVYTIHLGAIDPIGEVTGIQGRLRNLAYFDGEISGKWDEETGRALRAFQKRHNLPVTGEMDSGTESALKQEYGH